MNALAQLDPPLRPETLPPAHALVHVSYAVQVEAEPDSLCRILNLFALQSLMPHAVQATQLDDLLAVRIELGGVSWARAELIAQKMRNLICVAQVSLQGPGKIL
ncbi:hypothetical protein SJI00_19120 [Pseudomonas sp. RP23018S]|uniref:hypothetical protein n=1 Tax=Pseudomonas sp. RP23018S TaxID=3096037 RepID=UPI002ACAE022|nr:hypothetical protein [Pseudomonas sp. RP23018S]MDZ5604883.1 hypothetical protein [Pseudomonas sp. RP23018S]